MVQDDEPDDEALPTSDRVVQVAARLFREKGYGATTTREIAEELQLQKASLYHHINTKEELLFRICQEGARRLHADVRAAIASASSETRLEAVIQAHITAALNDKDMHAVSLIELRSLSGDRRTTIITRREEYLEMLEALVKDGQASGRLRTDISPRLLTLALLDLMNWTIFWYRPEGSMSPTQLADELTKIYFDGAAVR